MASAMQETIAAQPEELRRLLADDAAIGPAAERLRGRRILLVGTGTSWHAASIGAWFLRAAGAEAWAVQAMDAALAGPRPAAADALVLLSHRGTKRYTSDVVERARADGAARRGDLGPRRRPAPTSRRSRRSAPPRSPRATSGALCGSPRSPAPWAPTWAARRGARRRRRGRRGAADRLTPPARSLEFIGAGPNQWTAAEGALKVRETAYVAASGLAVEQYLHGPSVASGPATRSSP